MPENKVIPCWLINSPILLAPYRIQHKSLLDLQGHRLVSNVPWLKFALMPDEEGSSIGHLSDGHSGNDESVLVTGTFFRVRDCPLTKM